MVKISIDTRKIDRLVTEVFRDTVAIVSGEFTKGITDPIYPWGRSPSPRDIVDTGRLRASQQVSFIAPTTARWVWAVDYALPVHNGAVLRNGTILPPRKWTEVALRRRPPVDVFAKLLARKI